MSLVELSEDGPIAHLTLNRPDKRNALSPELLAELSSALHRLTQREAGSDRTRALVIAGAGPVFCAGGDIEAMQDRLGDPKATEATLRAGLNTAIERIANFPAPTIAAVQGAAIGAGLGVALACDITVASEQAKLGATHTRLGLTPDGGTSWLLTQVLGPKRALDVILGAKLLTGSEAHALRLVTDAVPEGELDGVVDARAQELAQGPTLAFLKARELVHAATRSSLAQALEAEAMSQAMMYASQDQREGVEAFLEKREANFEGR